MKRFNTLVTLTMAICVIRPSAQKTESVRYGDFNHWITRNIKESHIIGGKMKQVYEIGPAQTIEGDMPYVNLGGSPWATSNIMAKVCGITKTSNAVFPEQRTPGDSCVKMSTILENCKAIGIINIDVVVAGSIFLGRMFEPIKSTNDPYSKMEMGVPFTKRPKAMLFDYKFFIPEGNTRLYSSGFSSKKVLQGSDEGEAYIMLQRRWEDADGNLYAKRVATGRERFSKSTDGWRNGHRLELKYGDITNSPDFKPYMDLIPESKNYYARNSKGKMVPVREVGWDSPDATPTHLMIMFSSGSGEAYYGTVGTTLWVDNVRLEY